MLKYLILRVLGIIPLLLVVLVIIFTLGHLAPGDPIEMMYESMETVVATEEMVDRARARLGLDQPLHVQFIRYVGNVLRGDLGDSIVRSRPVLGMILKVFPISAQVGLLAFVVLVVTGIPLGVLAAVKQNTAVDYFIVGGSLFLRTVPVYVLAPLLFIILVLRLDIMNVPYGWKGITHPNVIMPTLMLILFPLAVVIRQMRVGILEVAENDYVRTARAKGLKERQVVLGHVMRNAITPVVTSLGLIVTGLITGSVFVEQIFGIPGYGNLFVTSLIQRDYPLMMDCTLFGAFLIMMSNLIVDFVYPFLDPRVTL